MKLYATYDLTTLRIVGWHQSDGDQAAEDGTNTGVRVVPGPRPPFSPQGYGFDGNFNIIPFVVGLEEARQPRLAEAWTYFNGLFARPNGFTISGTLFQIDSASQVQMAAMGVMALGSITDPANSPWPEGFYWVAADNSHVPMDAAAMYAFGRAVAAYVSACVLRLRAIKDAIAAAPDRATLNAIDVTAGYPAASA
jgi:hypothetical protein